MASKYYEFSIIQGGVQVAAGSCASKREAEREANHYALMYSQDGPVTVEVKEEKCDGKQ